MRRVQSEMESHPVRLLAQHGKPALQSSGHQMPPLLSIGAQPLSPSINPWHEGSIPDN
ncbi:MAG: hypothetical protein VYA27_11790 [Verrucomicrobiota bacterium]|nr:hypothetical protein [Verrucomicrobiota bacterium]